MSFYLAFLKVLGLLAVTAPVALGFGFLGAMAARARFAPVSWIGKAYIAIVRGVPDIAFFLFFVIALDQALEYARHRLLCPDWDQPIRQGSDFIVCQAAKLPQGSAPEAVHETYGFLLAVFTFAIVFGAFAANVLFGAMRAVPHAQLETAEAYGMTRRQTFWRILVPQMWVYALPGLSNLWLVLIKATPLLFLLGIEDIVYWARELGGTKTPRFTDYPHGDWRMWYFLALLVFYLGFTRVSEIFLERLMKRLTHGQATTGGEAQRRAGAVA
jgi:polar amino acid transport system permease protein